MQKELGMKSKCQNVLKLFKEPYSVESKRWFFFEFYISVAGGNSSLAPPESQGWGDASSAGSGLTGVTQH